MNKETEKKNIHEDELNEEQMKQVSGGANISAPGKEPFVLVTGSVDYIESIGN